MKNLICRYLCVAALFAFSLQANALEKPFQVDTDKYPYAPSLIQWQQSSAEFTPPEVCSGCHEEQYEQWMGSLHALAFKDPVYQGELNLAVKKVGHEISRQCEGCHSPAGVVTGEIKGPGNAGLSDMALAGVSCDICHSITGTTHLETPTNEPENGSFVLQPGIDREGEAVLVKQGPFAPDEECGMGFHECKESPLHLRSELCAGCHQVYHYDSHFPLEATYLEWKRSPYAQRSIQCQDCHMVETETFLKSADAFRKPQRSEYRHYFNGANYLLYHLAKAAALKAGDEELAAGIQKKFDMSVARLQAAADMEISPVYQNGRLVELKLRVKNMRAGHNLPTSLTNVRQLWLEISVRDEQGHLLYSSGQMNADGRLPENVRLFNSDGMGDDMHFSVDPWVITAFSRHDTIPPKGYKDVYYGIGGANLQGSLQVEAKLRYRQADQEVAEKLLANVPKDINLQEIYGLKEVPTLPVVDMVIKSASVLTHQ